MYNSFFIPDGIGVKAYVRINSDSMPGVVVSNAHVKLKD